MPNPNPNSAPGGAGRRPQPSSTGRRRKSSVGKIILIILLLIIFTSGGIIGGYYYLKTKTDTEKANLQKEIDQLKTQTESLNKQIETLKKQASFSTEECSTTLTEADLAAIEGWAEYTNDKYNCSLSYPKDWKVKTNQPDRFVAVGENNTLEFEFLSGYSAIRGYEEYDTISRKDIKIACIDSEVSYIKGNTTGNKDHRVIGATFTKDNVLHAMVISFTSQGASFDGDIEDAFDLIAKTIVFK